MTGKYFNDTRLQIVKYHWKLTDSLIIQKHCNNDGVAFFDHVEHYDVPRGLEYQDRICTGFCVLLPEGERQKYWKRVRSCADDD